MVVITLYFTLPSVYSFSKQTQDVEPMVVEDGGPTLNHNWFNELVCAGQCIIVDVRADSIFLSREDFWGLIRGIELINQVNLQNAH